MVDKADRLTDDQLIALMTEIGGADRVRRLFSIAAQRHLEFARLFLPDRLEDFVYALEREMVDRS